MLNSYKFGPNTIPFELVKNLSEDDKQEMVDGFDVLDEEDEEEFTNFVFAFINNTYTQDFRLSTHIAANVTQIEDDFIEISFATM